MKSCIILLLVIAIAASTPSVVAQDDLGVLLELSTQTKNQIQSQIDAMDDIPIDISNLLKQGSDEISLLQEAIANKDRETAKNHFLDIMQIYKQITRSLSTGMTDSDSTSSTSSQLKELNSKFQRTSKYAFNLKQVTKQYDTYIDFVEIDNLFGSALAQINNGSYNKAESTLDTIKQMLYNIKITLHQHASQDASNRTKNYAINYLDNLIEQISNRNPIYASDVPQTKSYTESQSQDVWNSGEDLPVGIYDDYTPITSLDSISPLDDSISVIAELEEVRREITVALDPQEIIQKARKIILIKDQFNITDYD